MSGRYLQKCAALRYGPLSKILGNTQSRGRCSPVRCGPAAGPKTPGRGPGAPSTQLRAPAGSTVPLAPSLGQAWTVKLAVRLAGVPICTWYAPSSTCGLAAPSMSPGVTASCCDTRKATCTVLVCPGLSVTLANPTSRWFGTVTRLTGWCTYTGTTSVPATLPVLDTVKVAVIVPLRETLAGADRPVTLKLV